MRNTKEIADYVFSIRDEHLRQKKLKQMRMKKACTAVSVMAAAGIITAGALHFSSLGTKPVKPSGSIVDDSEIDKPPVKPAVTSVTDSVSAVKTTATASVSARIDVSTVLSGTKTTPSAVSSNKKATASNAKTTVTAASQTASAAAATTTQAIITTDIDDVDCEEVIRMKVEYVKKYLAALSAAAIASSGNPISANAESLFTPKPLDPKVDSIIYIEDNTDLFDFDGSGKVNTMDAYALYTYVNEASELPEGYAERCEAYGDVNKDGKVDFADSNIFKEFCLLKYTRKNFFDYANNVAYLLPENTDPLSRAERSIRPDTPDDIRALLLNEFVDETYTYGSEKNKNEFIDYCFCNFGVDNFTFEKYNDAYFKRFCDGVKKDGYSFDVNEDGVTDLKDLYDIYIYEVASADEKDGIPKSFYFGQYNLVTEQIGDYTVSHSDYDNPLRSRLTLSEEYKTHLWEKCEPIYDYVYSFIKCADDDYYPMCTLRVYDAIARYIINNTEINTINKTSLYYVQYLGDVKLCDRSVSEIFASELVSFLDEFSEKSFVYDPHSGDLNPDYERIYDYDYMTNEELLEAFQKTKADYESGVIKKELFDINLDGKVDPLDSYTYELYSGDLHQKLTAEEGLVPAEQRKKIEEDFDPDQDGKSGTLRDHMFLSYIAGYSSSIPQYMLDVYYLELVEQKGLVDLSDIRPYIEKLCNGMDAGDVDLDGKVTAVDASGVLSYYAETSVNAEVSNVTVAMMSYMADLNEDGYVNSVDASAILSTYAENSVQN
jgi:hypothetical protein